jgi:hypothetical protein
MNTTQCVMNVNIKITRFVNFSCRIKQYYCYICLFVKCNMKNNLIFYSNYVKKQKFTRIMAFFSDLTNLET